MNKCLLYVFIVFSLMSGFISFVWADSAVVYNSTNGHYYQRIDSVMNWNNAKQAAEALVHLGLSGHLASVTSLEEHTFIVDNFGGSAVLHGYFLGGFQPVGSSEPGGNWQWVTGEPWNYTNWSSGEPSNAYGGNFGGAPAGSDEEVLQLWLSGKWNDMEEKALLPGYIVEYDIFQGNNTLLGPLPYLQFTDSPFSGKGFTYFHLEDFEDGLLDTPGVSANNGTVGSGLAADSVDGDDGDSTNNSCSGCDAYWVSSSNGATITFTFDESVLGSLPTHVGVVWTDGSGTVSFQAFDASGNSLGIVNGNHADGSFYGTTAEDRFYGVVNSKGVSAIKISSSSSNDIEIDHLQYGFSSQTSIDNGLVAYYPFNGNANDESGNGNDGTVNGATLASDRFGNENSAYKFDGVDDYIQVLVPLNGNADWTICAWINVADIDSSYTDWQVLLANSQEGFEVGFETSDKKLKIYDSWRLLSSADEIKTNTYFFICYQKTSDTLKIYKNGDVVGTNNSGSPVDFSEITTIGAWAPGASSSFDREPWNGTIDDIRIYNRALSEEEVKELYTKGRHSIYSTDFESGVGNEWSGSTPLATENNIFSNFLGRLGNETATLNLSGLGSGKHNISLVFDLYAIDSWDGDAGDYFGISGDYVAEWTIGESLVGGNPTFPWKPSVEEQLGYSPYIDRIFRNIRISFEHTGDNLNLNFYARNLQSLNDESWGLDNVKILASSTLKNPNLQIALINTATAALPGQEVDVSWKVTNVGSEATAENWQDCVYLSDDDQIGSDTNLGCLNRPVNLDVGEYYERTATVTIPNVGEGNYWVIVRADDGNSLVEDSENDNDVISGPVSISVLPCADLKSTNAAFSPGKIEAGDTISVDWVVTNAGSGATSAPFWFDGVYLSLDQVLDGNDKAISLGVQNPMFLNSGVSYSQERELTVPADLAGNYYVIVKTDVQGNISECNENNNIAVSSGTIQVDEDILPILTVTDLKVNPENPWPGDQITVTWTLENTGRESTGPFAIDHGILLSDDEVLDRPGDLGLAWHVGDFSGNLAPDETSTELSVTTNVPYDVWGNYQVIVWPDPNFNLDIHRSAGFFPIDIQPGLPSDLVLDSIDAPSTAKSSQAINIKWTVRNAASEPTHILSWSDKVYLSVDNDFQTINDNTLLDTFTHSGILNFDDTYEGSIKFSFAPTASGTYYIFVETDTANKIYEGDWENNNTASSSIEVSYEPPDLVINSVSVLADNSSVTSIVSNTGVTVKWTAANSGVGNVPNNSWYDNIYISKDSALDSNDRLLASHMHSGSLNVSESYESSRSINIPIDVTGAEIYIFSCADGNNTVHESEDGNNCNPYGPFEVTWAKPDLIVSSFYISQGVPAGGAVNINWSVKNVGGPTNITDWNDTAYLSQNRWLDGSDIELKNFPHTGALGYKESYSISETNLAIPENMSGSYYVIIAADTSGSVEEFNENNNDSTRYKNEESNNQGGGGEEPQEPPLNPKPPIVTGVDNCKSDLIVTNYNIPSDAISGQIMSIEWTVENQGEKTTNNSVWNDAAYLSRDQHLDRDSDIYIGYLRHNGSLESNADYNSPVFDARIPYGLTGNYYVLIGADSNNNVCESSEDNNGNDTPNIVNVELPLPTDLTVTDVSIPAAGQLGEEITVQWTVKNIGGYEAKGRWHDSVYISSDTVWDLGDKEIGKITHSGPLSKDDSYVETLTAPVPGVTTGDYYIIVRTDIHNELPEPDDGENNNTFISSGQINIDCWELTLDTPDNSQQISTGSSHYYKVTVDAGEDLLVTLDSVDNDASTELYIRYEAVPTRSRYDFSYSNDFAADQEVTVPITKAGTYYILVYGDNTLGTSYTIEARLLPFDIFSVTSNVGGNAGTTTVHIAGSKLSGDTTARLISSEGVVVAEATLVMSDSTDVYAAFNLEGVDTGTYSVEIERPGETPKTLENVFKVEHGVGPQLQANIVVPQLLRVGQEYTMWIEYENIGDSDMTAPLFSVSSPQNIPMNLTQSDEYTNKPVQILGISFDGPAGILRPGEKYNIPIYFKAMNETGAMKLELKTVGDGKSEIDWEEIQENIKPENIDEDYWNSIWSNFTNNVGSTTADYVKMLSANATYISKNGNYTYDVNELFSLEMNNATGGFSLGKTLVTEVDAFAPAPGLPLVFSRLSANNLLQRFIIGPFGRAWSHNYDYSLTKVDDYTVSVNGPNGESTRFNKFVIYSNTISYRWSYKGKGSGSKSFKQKQNTSCCSSKNSDSFVELIDGSNVITKADATEWFFNTDGHLGYIEDDNDNRITLIYKDGKLIKISHSDGDSFSIEYSPDGFISQLKDHTGKVTKYSYDYEHLSSVTTPANRTATYTYVDSAGTSSDHALKSIEYPDGTHRNYEYNNSGWITKLSSPTSTTQFASDSIGNIQVTGTSGEVNSMKMGQGGQPTETTDPFGNITKLEYNNDNALTRVIRPDGKGYSLSYDSDGNVSAQTDSLGNKINLTYDDGYIADIRDARGNTTQYKYDDKGNVTGITYPSGKTETFGYDGRGNMTVSVNRRGNNTTYTYNKRGLLEKKTFSDGSSVEYTYDAYGKILSATDARGTIRMAYDSADRLTSTSYPTGQTVTISYDGFGRRSKITNNDGCTVNYYYDSAGRIEKLTDETDKTIVSYEYDSASRRAKKIMGNGAYTTYDYDKAGQLLSLVNYAADNSILNSFSYTYDNLGRRSEMVTLDGTWTYKYDATSQLTHAVFTSTNPEIPSQNLTYTYDAAGNRIATNTNGTTSTYTTNNLNQYTNDGTNTYTYDADGNMASKTDNTGTWTYKYNVENKLVEVKNSTSTITYAYDPFGRRVEKNVDGVITRYVYDGGDVLFELDGSNTQITCFVHGPDINELITMTEDVDSDGNIDIKVFFQSDGSRNIVTAITNSFLNNISSYRYKPFGGSAGRTGTFRTPYGPNGRRYDPETGNQYNYPGYYDSDNGRPLGNIGNTPPGNNSYKFPGNNPINMNGLLGLNLDCKKLVDYSGRAADKVFDEKGYIYKRLPKSEYIKRAKNLWKKFNGRIKQCGSFACDIKEFLEKRKTEPLIDSDKIWNRFADLFSGGLGCASAPLQAKFDLARELVEVLADISIQVIGSFDPNEKLGPNGFADNGFIPKGVSSQYTINFENLPDATAPANQVIVTDQLSENFDWRTLQLSEITFGDTVVQVPGRRSHYTDDILMPNGLIARINAGLNIQTGVVTWRITAIDPETGKTHENPLLGLLPPNDPETHDGEGHVTFLIRPKTDIATGTEINNKAIIVFDTNEPIETNEVFSTVDNDAPSSSVISSEEQTDSSYKVSWSGDGDDNGSDIAGYDIYVSDNGGKYTLWLGNTKDMFATYTGEPGHTYSFYSVARDNAGNVEKLPEEPDIIITISVSTDKVPTLTEWGVLLLFIIFLCAFYKNKTNYVIHKYLL